MNIIQKASGKLSKISPLYAAALAGLTTLAWMPALAFAQNIGNITSPASSGATTLSQTSTLNDVATKIIGLFNVAIYLIVALAILTFVWNVYQYFVVKDPENRKEAGAYVMYSVVGIFVILSFWGLVSIISNTLNINTSSGSVNVGNLIGNISGGSSGVGSPFTGTSGSTGGSTISSFVSPSATGATQNQAVYQQQANQAQASLQANGCYTTGGAIVNTPTCQGLYTSYSNAQNQANVYAQSAGESTLQQCVDSGESVTSCDGQYGNDSNPSAYQQCLESGYDSTSCDKEYGAGGSSLNSSSGGESTLQQCVDSGESVTSCDGQYGNDSNPSAYQQCLESGYDSTSCDEEYGAGGSSLNSSSGGTDCGEDCPAQEPDNYSIDQGGSSPGNSSPGDFQDDQDLNSQGDGGSSDAQPAPSYDTSGGDCTVAGSC